MGRDKKPGRKKVIRILKWALGVLGLVSTLYGVLWYAGVPGRLGLRPGALILGDPELRPGPVHPERGHRGRRGLKGPVPPWREGADDSDESGNSDFLLTGPSYDEQIRPPLDLIETGKRVVRAFIQATTP
jgi:hypothetical protein